MLQVYANALKSREEAGTRRKLVLQKDPCLKKDSSLVTFSSNDYLGLSRCPLLLKSAIEYGKVLGCGATGSRLLSGNSLYYEALEQRIAKDKHSESALFFSSGFQANYSVLTALLNKKIHPLSPVVFFDKNNHASLYEAALSSGAELVRFPSNDVVFLKRKIETYKKTKRPLYLVFESVYGMHGTMAPMEKYLELARDYDLFLYVDEAHATGVYGPQGYGLSTHYSFNSVHAVIMGTFGKALGSSGAYIACTQLIKDYLLNYASGFVYSTAPSPLVLGACTKAWERVKELDSSRAHLYALRDFFRKSLEDFAHQNPSTSHIFLIPFPLKKAISVHEHLMHQGMHTSLIRPPTVAKHDTGIRIALCAYHSEQHITALLKEMERFF
jgi:8-amino-7-oxononanoate synthase